jgi:hypothetical protein
MNIKILDTGYIINGLLSAQTRLGLTLRAGYDGTSSVNAFTLKVAGLNFSSDASTESKPIANTLTDVSTTIVSTENPKVKLSCVMQKRITTTSWSTNDVYQLSRLRATRGLKLLYVDATTDVNKTIVEALGAINTNGYFAAASPSTTNGTVSTTTPYLIGRIKNLSFDDNPSGDYWRINFDFELSI